MRYKAGHREEAHAKMLAAAGRGFRRKGFGGIGVDGLAKEAKVTSGAFYGHFASKDEAFKAVIVAGLVELRANIETLRAERGDGWIKAFVDFYLGERRTCELGASCALQSLASEVQRSDDETKAAFEAEIARVIDAIAAGLDGRSRKDRESRAWALLSILSGGVTMARAVGDEAAGAAIAAACRSAALAIADKA
jgi:AcrR family transcriptional regulator